ncbi:MAG: phospholipase D-like domain-containing protein, partial [Acidobacteriota bacterium]
RSFGVIVDDRATIDEAVRIFEADARQSSIGPTEKLIVSPLNSRSRINDYLVGARRQLLIYDGRLTDPAMMRTLAQRARSGVDIRVIGDMSKRVKDVAVKPMPTISLHAQAIIRDGESVFLGSQSLRKAELDYRREVGIIVDDPAVVKHLTLIFELDWGDIVNS